MPKRTQRRTLQQEVEAAVKRGLSQGYYIYQMEDEILKQIRRIFTRRAAARKKGARHAKRT